MSQQPSTRTEKRFVYYFVAFALVFLALGHVFVSYSDPFRVLNMPWRTSCSFHKNDSLRKFELMEASPDVEAVIVGASTSEAFNTENVQNILKVKKAFNTTVAGLDTTSRLVLLRKALVTFKNLKYVIFVSDLYEYNAPKTTTWTYYQKQLSAFIPPALWSAVQPAWKQRLYDVYANHAFESASANLKDCLKGTRKEFFFPDGMPTRSRIIDEVSSLSSADPEYQKKVNRAFEKAMTNHVGIIKGMKELSPTVKELVRTAVDDVKKRSDVQMLLLISPYHPAFKPVLEKNKLTHFRKEWVDFIHTLEGENVKVFDYEEKAAFGPEYIYWQDGHHFRPGGARLILEDMAKFLNKM